MEEGSSSSQACGGYTTLASDIGSVLLTTDRALQLGSRQSGGEEWREAAGKNLGEGSVRSTEDLRGGGGRRNKQEEDKSLIAPALGPLLAMK